MIKKTIGKWWICVDFMDLNKACLNDSFSLSKIDKLMDTITGFEFFCFFDTNSIYHQILIHPYDKEKKSFIFTMRNIYGWVL